MSTVIAPLLSFSASGSIADTLTSFVYKGSNVMRAYAKPSGAPTQTQLTHRALVASVVSVWRHSFTNIHARPAWDTSASLCKTPMSGYNLFFHNAMLASKTNPDASFCWHAVPRLNRSLLFWLLNISDGSTGTETGNFDLLIGDSPKVLTLADSQPIDTGTVYYTGPFGIAGDVKFCSLRKDGIPRHGIQRLVLSDTDPPDWDY